MAPSRGSHRDSGRQSSKALKPRPAQRTHNSSVDRKVISITLQQSILDVFVKAFPNLLTPPHIEKRLKPALQEVKSHLYNRDFGKAFGDPNYLDAYAVRWSASRSLGFLEIFNDVFEDVISLDDNRHDSTTVLDRSEIREGGSDHEQCYKVLCLGGGAGSELVALAGLLRARGYLANTRFDVSFIDIADWSKPLDILYETLTSIDADPASLESLNDSSIDSTKLLIPAAQMTTNFHCLDLLNVSHDQSGILQAELQRSRLITLMFTLNELYCTSLQKTQTLLLDLTAQVRRGTYFLVVDSAGSYSTVTVNQKEKKYPMQWLLDHTLMKLAPEAVVSGEKRSEEDGAEKDGLDKANDNRKSPTWERVTSTDSRWFRLADLRYPLELENMRYQLHLYRRV